MDRDKIIEEISNMMGQGKTGLKQGYTDEYAMQLLEEAKQYTESDRKAQEETGYKEFSRQRSNLGYENWIDKKPENPKERNQQLRYLKTILKDPSSTVEGAKEIQRNLSTIYGEDLSQNQTVNLLRVMGKAEAKGVRVDERMFSSGDYREVFEEIPDELLTPEEIDKIADDVDDYYKVTTGIKPSSKQERKDEMVSSGVEKRAPRITVRSRDNRQRNTTRIKRSGGNKKFTESTTHKHRRKPTKKY